jgi:all-trans-retinol 13,14-reductase
MDPMDYDVIIVGAGLGGLTTGAILAKHGQKVLVIEQHSIPGGCATTFRRHDLRVEVGLHMMDGLDEADPKVPVLKELGVLDHVDFIRTPEFYRVVKGNTDISIPSDIEEAERVILEKFPHEKRGIAKFFKTLAVLRKEANKLPRNKWRLLLILPVFPLLFPKLMKYMKTSVGEFLDSIFSDEELKLILLGNLGYYHDDPYTTTMLYYAPGQASFLTGGGYFVNGGSLVLSDYLASLIEKNNGTLFYNNLVEEIIVENGRAIGVKYRKSDKSGGEQTVIKASYIIANAAVPNVINQHIRDPGARKKLEKAQRSHKPGPAILSLYLGFRSELKELGLNTYSNILQDDGLSSQALIREYLYHDLEKRSLIFVDYGQIDSGLAPEGKSVGVVVAFDTLEKWESLTKEEYKRKKEETAQILIGRLENFLPGIKNEIEYYEVATPLTIKRYTLNPEGTAYGFAQTPSQAGSNRFKIDSPVKNLYFASAWAEPGGGFSGAINSGIWCAQSILKK